MKSTPSPARGAFVTRFAGLATLLTPAALLAAEPDPAAAVPTGSLSLDRNLVRTGSAVDLSWSVQHPSPPPTLHPEEAATLKVRLLGLAYGILKNNNGHGNNIDGVDSSNPGNRDGDTSDYDDEKWQTQSQLEDLPVKIFGSTGAGALVEIFSGDVDDVDPGRLLVETRIDAGARIAFGAQGWKHQWTKVYTTTDDTANVAVLRNGDPLPETSTAFSLGLITPYLKPYIDAGRKVRIGPRDLLVLWELDTTNPGHLDFDLQDAAILVTFE